MIITFIATILSFGVCSEDIEFAPPIIQINDELGVNIGAGEVNASLTDINIGGKLGLSHSITTYRGSMAYYIDSFTGGIQLSQIKTSENTYESVLRAFGFGNADFFINGDGTYTAVKDKRHTLEYKNNTGYVYIGPDGTQVIYPSSDNYDPQKYYGRYGYSRTMTKVIKPNGLVMTINRGINNSRPLIAPIYSVTTNTGYQLKYLYELHSRPLTESKRGAPLTSSIAADSYAWSTRYPKYVKGINNAVEYCTTSNGGCSLTKNWPQTIYNWPDGMPRAFYIGNSVFSVTDAMGRVTEYHHTAIDYNWSGQCLNLYEPGEGANVKISGIKEATSQIKNITYHHENEVENPLCPNYSATPNPITYAELQYAIKNGVKVKYDMWEGHYISGGHLIGIKNKSDNKRGIKYVLYAHDIGVPIEVNTWVNRTKMYSNFSNRLYEANEKLGGEQRKYLYDERGNLKTIRTFGHNGTTQSAASLNVEAQYPTTCSNRKTCNKPIWTKDKNGNKTSYTYHLESGQVESITRSVNEHGIRPQIRYSYLEKFASYKINSNAVEESRDGLWLVTTESYCINSSYSGSACTGNDLSLTSYEYEPSNLALVGVAITAAGKTLRTCYSYDIYGNKIGETKPKSGLATCIN